MKGKKWLIVALLLAGALSGLGVLPPAVEPVTKALAGLLAVEQPQDELRP